MVQQREEYEPSAVTSLVGVRRLVARVNHSLDLLFCSSSVYLCTVPLLRPSPADDTFYVSFLRSHFLFPAYDSLSYSHTSQHPYLRQIQNEFTRNVFHVRESKACSQRSTSTENAEPREKEYIQLGTKLRGGPIVMRSSSPLRVRRSQGI